MNKSQLVSDIILRVTKGKPADDLELEPKQVEFWISLVLNSMIKDSIEEKENGQLVPSFFIIKEACKKLYEETYSCIEDEDELLFIELRKPVLESISDSAVVRVTTNEGSVINKARLTTIDFIKDMEFSKPTTKNLVYYRDGKKKVVIMGVPRELIDIIEIFVWYVPQTDLDCFSDEEELPIPDDKLEELLARVEDVARRQMFGVGDVTNEGHDDLPNVVENG